MGTELDDEKTTEECKLEQGSCVLVSFIQNENGTRRRREAPSIKQNIQFHRAEEIQMNSDEMIEMCLACCTPSVVMVVMGLMLISVWIIRFIFSDSFSTGTDIAIGILNIFYIIILVKNFILQR